MLKKISWIFLAGLLMSFAWPVRGQFGHENGALICGALAAVITGILIIGSGWRPSFAQAVILGSLGFSIGGTFSYGSLVDTIVAAASLKDVIPQLIHVFLIGAVWGLLGMLFLGFAIGELEFLIQDAAVLIVTGGSIWLGTSVFKTGPEMAWLAGGAALLQAYNAFWKKSGMVSLFSVFGFLGFGLGFLIAVLILWYGSHGYLPGSWWSLRDQIWGFIGGVSVLLAGWTAVSRGFVPAPVPGSKIQRAGFIFFASFVTGINVWNVYEKWFKSEPPVANPFWPAVYLIVCAFVLIILAIYFLKSVSDIFSGEGLDKTLGWSTLFFCWFLAILAIAKSIVYSGWSAWETAFTLFLIECVIFTIAIPRVLKQT